MLLYHAALYSLDSVHDNAATDNFSNDIEKYADDPFPETKNISAVLSTNADAGCGVALVTQQLIASARDDASSANVSNDLTTNSAAAQPQDPLVSGFPHRQVTETINWAEAPTPPQVCPPGLQVRSVCSAIHPRLSQAPNPRLQSQRHQASSHLHRPDRPGALHAYLSGSHTSFLRFSPPLNATQASTAVSTQLHGPQGKTINVARVPMTSYDYAPVSREHLVQTSVHPRSAAVSMRTLARPQQADSDSSASPLQTPPTPVRAWNSGSQAILDERALGRNKREARSAQRMPARKRKNIAMAREREAAAAAHTVSGS